MRKLTCILSFGLMLALSACSDDQAKAKKDHVWKSKTDTIQQSKDAAKQLQKNLDEQNRKLKQNN